MVPLGREQAMNLLNFEWALGEGASDEFAQF
jgi:hypothetical protein